MSPRHARRWTCIVALTATVIQSLAFVPLALAATPDEAFSNVWSTTDLAVENGAAGYSWFWGPDSRAQLKEAYAESPGKQREVRYYDKSRMEITHPGGDSMSIWYVTNGLLTVELLSGRHQIGDSSFELLSPGRARVAGDQSDNPGTPTYEDFAAYATTNGQTHVAPDRTGQHVTEFLSGEGALSSTDDRGVILASYQSATGHNIANVFWDWAQSSSSGLRPEQGVDWLYVLGYPVSEPYWIDSTVAGTTRRVLVQLFQRRVLTYDASNPAAYRVEFGNIGQHYYSWLYEQGTLPVDGGSIYEWSLADWPDAEFPFGKAYAEGGTYHHYVDASADADVAPSVFSFLAGIDRPHLRASIRVRMVSPDARYSEGCLMIRLEFDLSRDYAFCINGEGQTVGLFEDNSGGVPEIETLLPYDIREGTNPADQWNELGIVALENHLWFLINENVVADIWSKNMSSGGMVGFYVINFDQVPVEFEWNALTVRALE